MILTFGIEWFSYVGNEKLRNIDQIFFIIFVNIMEKQIKRGKYKQSKTALTDRALLHHNARTLANQFICYMSLIQ